MKPTLQEQAYIFLPADRLDYIIGVGADHQTIFSFPDGGQSYNFSSKELGISDLKFVAPWDMARPTGFCLANVTVVPCKTGNGLPESYFIDGDLHNVPGIDNGSIVRILSPECWLLDTGRSVGIHAFPIFWQANAFPKPLPRHLWQDKIKASGGNDRSALKPLRLR